VSRWNPGFVEDLSQHEGDVESVSANLVEAARRKLENSVVLSATKDDLRMNTLPSMAPMSPFSGGMAPISEAEGGTPAKSPIRPPRRRVRIVSTPAGKRQDMFGEVAPEGSGFQPSASVRARARRQKTLSTPLTGNMFGDTAAAVVLAPGEVLLNVTDAEGKKMRVRVDEELYKKMKESTVPLTLQEAKKETIFAGEFLDGFVRKEGRSRTLSNLSDKL